MKKKNLIIKYSLFIITILQLYACKKTDTDEFQPNILQKIIILIVLIILFKNFIKYINEYIKEICEHRKKMILYKRKIAKDKLLCNFEKSISEEKFVEIVKKCTKGFNRIKNVNIIKAIVACDIVSYSGKSDFNFCLNFNDWGYLTGDYKIIDDNDNPNSNMPIILGDMIKMEILTYYKTNKVKVKKLKKMAKANEKRVSKIF